MKIALLKEKKIKGTFSTIHRNLPVLEIEKKSFSELKNFNILILLTKKILDRKSSNYKKVVLFTKKNNIKLIEVAFEKSNISQEKAYSQAIIHGFEDNTGELIKKIIQDYEILK